jgi:hypothetical protein
MLVSSSPTGLDPNAYAFLNENPPNNIDPLGLYPHIKIDYDSCSCWVVDIAFIYKTIVNKMLALQNEGNLPQAQPFSAAIPAFLGNNSTLKVTCGGWCCKSTKGQGCTGGKDIHLCVPSAFKGTHKLGTVLVVEATKALGYITTFTGEYPYANWLDGL